MFCLLKATDVLIPVGIFAALGVVLGLLLAFAFKIFSVKTDERAEKILECLPGANCGGCGYSGCSGFANALTKGEAKPESCRSCKPDDLARIGEILGIEVKAEGPIHARVMCSGDCNTAKLLYNYEGVHDCFSAARLGWGGKMCPSGCLGLGTCVSACRFDAIHVENGLAVVDPNKCTGCGACSKVCPKQIIAMIPVSSGYFVACHSVENGAKTRKQCDAGCISCKICEKNCPAGAITVNDFVASIDQSKCIGCGLCASKCPRKIIKKLH